MSHGSRTVGAIFSSEVLTAPTTCERVFNQDKTKVRTRGGNSINHVLQENGVWNHTIEPSGGHGGGNKDTHGMYRALSKSCVGEGEG